MSPSTLPALASKALIVQRLASIFPEGTPNRGYCTRDLAASTVFAMLYVGAVEGSGQYLAPKHVYRMTDDVAASTSDDERRRYAVDALKPGYQPAGRRWYADNTREPIRDETLREGLVPTGAVHVRSDLPTTSSKPRYALDAELAAVFDPALGGTELLRHIRDWQRTHLTKGALARIALRRSGASTSKEGVLVTFPSGETRRMAPGPSSAITRAVVEDFAVRFLEEPVVLWLSESGRKVVARDDALAARIGLKIEADRNLPDIILVDLAGAEPLMVLVEVVATDGPVSERRREALLKISDTAGFARGNVAFVTAYADRDTPAFKKTISALAWDSFAWLATEPEGLIVMRGGTPSTTLRTLTRRT